MQIAIRPLMCHGHVSCVSICTYASFTRISQQLHVRSILLCVMRVAVARSLILWRQCNMLRVCTFVSSGVGDVNRVYAQSDSPESSTGVKSDACDCLVISDIYYVSQAAFNWATLLTSFSARVASVFCAKSTWINRKEFQFEDLPASDSSLLSVISDMLLKKH